MFMLVACIRNHLCYLSKSRPHSQFDIANLPPMKRDAEDLEPEFGMNSDNESAEAGQPQKKMRLDDDKARKWRETCSTPSGVPDEQLEIVQHALELSSSTLDIELKPESFVAYPKPGADDAHKYGL